MTTSDTKLEWTDADPVLTLQVGMYVRLKRSSVFFQDCGVDEYNYGRIVARPAEYNGWPVGNAIRVQPHRSTGRKSYTVLSSDLEIQVKA